MRKIKVFWNINELAHWQEVFDQQWECMVRSGLATVANEIVLMCSGRPRTFAPLLDSLKNYNVRLVNVCNSAALHEYPGLDLLHKEARETEEPYDICYIHMKGLTRWGNPHVEDWKAWLNWCVIERWVDNVKALETHDTSGPNWDMEPWPHHSSNFWWAKSEYVAGLVQLVHPHKKISAGATQFKYHGHWRFDHEAWIGSGNPTPFEVARSFEVGGDHYEKPFPRKLYRDD
jgi:hypothetical protein